MRAQAAPGTYERRPSNVDWHGCDLSNADLRGAILPRADQRGANPIRANLYKAHLQNANLVFANPSGAVCNTRTTWPDDTKRPPTD